MKYVLLFVDTEEFARDLEAMGPADRERAYQQVVEWMATHAGNIRGGNKLRPPETATTVRLDRGEPAPGPRGRTHRPPGNSAAAGQYLGPVPAPADAPAGPGPGWTEATCRRPAAR